MIGRLNNILPRLLCLMPVCLFFSGCGLPNRGIKNVNEPIPLSNIQVEEKVIRSALKDLGLPGGQSREVMCMVNENSRASEILRIIASEVLLEQQYSVTEKKSSVPVLRFSVDTLRVVLTSERLQKKGKGIKRFAEAHISCVFLETSGSRYVFRGKGTYEDSFASHMLNSLGESDQYVTNHALHDRYTEKVKPVVFGVTMTILTWMLYSFRG